MSHDSAESGLDGIPPASVNSDSANDGKENVSGVSCPKYMDGKSILMFILSV